MFPAPFGAGGLIWEEPAPAKVTGLGKEDQNNQKSAPKKAALKLKILGDVQEPCPWPNGAKARNTKVASAQQPSLDLSLPAQGVSATKVLLASLHTPEPFNASLHMQAAQPL